MSTALTPHGFDQIPQAWNEPVVADSKQGSACDIANAGCLNDYCSRPARCEASVPLNNVWSDESIFGGPPGNHCRNPGPAFECDWANINRSEQQRSRRLFLRRPACCEDGMADWVFGMPHKNGDQKSEIGGRKVRDQKSDVGRQRSEVRRRRSKR